MASEVNSQAAAIGEIITWLEQQLRQVRDDQTRSVQQVDQLRRQVHDLQEQITLNERAVRVFHRREIRRARRVEKAVDDGPGAARGEERGEPGQRPAQIVVEDDRVRPEASEVFELIADATQLRDLTGWTPQGSLREGLERTATCVEANLARLKPGVYNV